jgi:hypothetical protein
MKIQSAKSDAVRKKLLRENVRLAGGAARFSSHAIDLLTSITRDFGFSFKAGELQIIDGNWYVTHTGLLRLARRKRCRGINVETVNALCDSTADRFVLKVHGAEMRVAETRAVNRALRKAYGIGICSV